MFGVNNIRIVFDNQGCCHQLAVLLLFSEFATLGQAYSVCYFIKFVSEQQLRFPKKLVYGGFLRLIRCTNLLHTIIQIQQATC